MEEKFMKHLISSASIFLFLCNNAVSQNIGEFVYKGSFNPSEQTINSDFQFNGYTNYWHDTFRDEIRYGNLFKQSVPDVQLSIAQARLNIADDLNIPGLKMQEGFLSSLFSGEYNILDQPELRDLNIIDKPFLVLTDPSTEAGKKLTGKLPLRDEWKEKLKSHQTDASDFTEVNLFFLENGDKKIYVISSVSKELRDKILFIITNTKDILSKYDLHRGWFGTETLLKSVTCTAGHPLEVIGKGMNEGNTWFTFCGYMDFLTQDELVEWLRKVNLPVVADVGTNMNYIPTSYNQAIYGCDNYDSLLIQSMYTLEFMINYAHKKNGYSFRSVYDPAADMYIYDGYIAGEGNKEQADNENKPFVTPTGSLDKGTVPCMVLFLRKGEAITKDLMWEAIMKRREVAVTGSGKMMGPELYRNALELLLLDREYLEEYFGDRINLEANTDGYFLNITISNTYQKPVKGEIEIVLPPELESTENLVIKTELTANSNKTIRVKLKPSARAMGITNPVAVHFKWNNRKKSTLTILDLPPAISVHNLLYGHAPVVSYPVTIHNFTDQPSATVRVEVMDKNEPKNILFTASETVPVETGSFKDLAFNLEVSPGGYNIKVSACGIETMSQLGVGAATGSPRLTVTDLNSDGVNEYIMENDSVKLTLLTTGARVIEYIVKSKNDNVMYKQWPVKPEDDKRSFRKRGYYPYGGFEDFLGQASMETHKVYDAEILKAKGDYLQVRMTADYYDNKLEKTYTLYGNSPLLEVRFAVTFRNPEANMIAPVPVLELGRKHWTEDVFIAPEIGGLKEYRMLPERYYGRVILLKEGWDAGYDTMEDISFVAAFPVKPPLFLHMFMNHPRNPDAHFYCHEFQPWVPIFSKSTMYFTYYFWGKSGNWQEGVKSLRERNLITTR
ncbi:MAG TPA: hypothetical protein VMV47_12410 [Bacteroidales bacterium]|nr:hypothetical protein [Bacteroidales bacterium]